MSSDAFLPQDRVLRARLAAHTRWSQQDPRAGTQKARETFLRSFLDVVDPERRLPEDERLRRAESARKAHFTKLALASARSRRSKA